MMLSSVDAKNDRLPAAEMQEMEVGNVGRHPGRGSGPAYTQLAHEGGGELAVETIVNVEELLRNRHFSPDGVSSEVCAIRSRSVSFIRTGGQLTSGLRMVSFSSLVKKSHERSRRLEM